MPTFQAAADFPVPPSALFDLLVQPALVTRLMPPELQPRLLEGPERVSLGDRLRIETRYMGVRQTLTLRIIGFELDRLLTDEQIDGPFRSFRQERRLTPTAGGVQLSETIDYEPPGGMLGFLLTPARIERNLADMYSHRIQALRELLTPKPSDRP